MNSSATAFSKLLSNQATGFRYGVMINSVLKNIGIPLLGIGLFLLLWAGAAQNIDTSLGKFPGPSAVSTQFVALYNEHIAEREKADKFYQRQEKRNAERLAKACGKDSHTKISFLIKKIEQQNALLFQSINQIIPDIYLIKKYQKPLHKFLLTVKLSILESPEVNVDSDLLFKLSTEIVDAQWMAVSQGIQRVEDLCYRGLIEN